MNINFDKNNFLTRIDHYSEYVPIISYITLFVNAIQDKLIIPKMESNQVYENKYFSHIKSKSTTRKIVLLVPLIGNIIVAVLDALFKASNDRNFQLERIKNNGELMRFASAELKSDFEFVKEAVTHDSFAIHFVEDQLKNHKEIILAAIENLQNFQNENPEKVFEVRNKSKQIAKGLNESNRADPEIMDLLVQLNGELISYSSPELQEDDLHIGFAVEENLYALRFIDLEKAVTIACEKIESDPQLFYELPTELMANLEVWRVYQEHPNKNMASEIIEYAKPRELTEVEIAELEEVYGTE
jgi:hypothetical protein